MDLGATLCTRRRPVCALCPLEDGCGARAERRQHELPAPRPKRERPQRRTAFLILRDAGGAFLLERRPPSGVWGGLFGFPEGVPGGDLRADCERRFDVEVKAMQRLGDLHHGFTHYALDIEPHLFDVVRRGSELRDGDGRIWHTPGDALEVGLAVPVSRLIEMLAPGRGRERRTENASGRFARRSRDARKPAPPGPRKCRRARREPPRFGVRFGRASRPLDDAVPRTPGAPGSATGALRLGAIQ